MTTENVCMYYVLLSIYLADSLENANVQSVNNVGELYEDEQRYIELP